MQKSLQLPFFLGTDCF